MVQLTCKYDLKKCDFSFTMNNKINSNPVIKYLIKNGIYCCSQCPEDISFLLNVFPIDSINAAFESIENFRIHPKLPKNQIIELIIKNHFPYGINTYSSNDMKHFSTLFSSYASQPNIERKKLSKYLRDSKEIICIDRGKYAHVNQLQQLCYHNKKAVNDLLTALEELILEKNIISGREAFLTLHAQCKKLNLTNQYALYGFIKWIKLKNISHIQNQIGQITYARL